MCVEMPPLPFCRGRVCRSDTELCSGYDGCREFFADMLWLREFRREREALRDVGGDEGGNFGDV